MLRKPNSYDSSHIRKRVKSLKSQAVNQTLALSRYPLRWQPSCPLTMPRFTKLLFSHPSTSQRQQRKVRNNCPLLCQLFPPLKGTSLKGIFLLPDKAVVDPISFSKVLCKSYIQDFPGPCDFVTLLRYWAKCLNNTQKAK